MIKIPVAQFNLSFRKFWKIKKIISVPHERNLVKAKKKASSAEKKFTDFEFISEPFQCGVLKNIIENSDTGIF